MFDSQLMMAMSPKGAGPGTAELEKKLAASKQIDEKPGAGDAEGPRISQIQRASQVKLAETPAKRPSILQSQLMSATTDSRVPQTQKTRRNAKSTITVKEDKRQKENRKLFDFYNNFQSRFMPGEHMGIKPEMLQIDLLGGKNKAPTNFYQSKSPLHGFDFESFEKKKRKDGGEESSESDDFKRLQKQKENEKRKIFLEEMKVQNDKFVKSIFEAKRVSANEIANIHGRNFLNQHARRYKSAMR